MPELPPVPEVPEEPPDFLVGFLRSLVRVPPSISYSLLSGPYCASPAERKRRFISLSSDFLILQLVLVFINFSQLLVVAVETGADRANLRGVNFFGQVSAEIWFGVDCLEAGEPFAAASRTADLRFIRAIRHLLEERLEPSGGEIKPGCGSFEVSDGRSIFSLPVNARDFAFN